MKKLVASVLSLSIALILVSCGEEGNALVEFKVRWATQTGETCELTEEHESGSTGYQQDRLPDTIQELQIMLLNYYTGDIVKETRIKVLPKCSGQSNCIEQRAPRFEWHGIPTGRFKLKIVGYEAEGSGLQLRVGWIGVNKRVDITTSTGKVQVEVFMKRVNAITRPFNCMSQPRAFHQSVEVRDGSILIFGGITQYVANDSPPDKLIATASVEKFDPTTGEFVEMTSMSVPRAFHKAIRLQDGYILIIGGASEVYFDPSQESVDQFGVHFKPVEGKLQGTIEIYDPSGAGSVVAANIPLNEARMLFDVAVIPANPLSPDNPGELFLISGGVNESGKLNSVEVFNYNYTDLAAVWPLRSATLLDTHLSVARAGHAFVGLNDGARILALGGGNVGDSPIEFLEKPTEQFFALDNAQGAIVNTVYSTAVLFSINPSNTQRQIILYGGMEKDDTGAFVNPRDNNPTRIVSYDHQGATPNVVFASTNSINGAAFAAGAKVSDNLAIFAGGAYGKDLTEISNIIEYTTDGLNFLTATDYSGNPILLRAYINPNVSDPSIHGRMGHTASRLPEGGIIFIGGLDKPTQDSPSTKPFEKSVLKSAEMLILIPSQ